MPLTQTHPPAWLLLEDGTCWQGQAVGALGQTFGELVFNTAMTGYQEILTDPSYKGQVVLMTYPEIGNYGINDDDDESSDAHVAGFVVRHLSAVTSSWRASGSLGAWLRNKGIIALQGVDTRAITRHVRKAGAMKCALTTQLPTDVASPAFAEAKAELLAQVIASPALADQPLVASVTTPHAFELVGTRDVATEGDYPLDTLVAVDFGMKLNILRQFRPWVRRLVVLPASATLADVQAYQPQAVFLSNGPGDPNTLPEAMALAKGLIDSRTPTFGICLGHQLLALALGLKVEKMMFGHHGGNHPVRDLELGKNLITSQNHGYCVMLSPQDEARHPIKVTHRNLNDGSVEGFRHTHLPVAAVQFHPEAAPGPHDAHYLFERFLIGLTQTPPLAVC